MELRAEETFLFSVSVLLGLEVEEAGPGLTEIMSLLGCKCDVVFVVVF